MLIFRLITSLIGRFGDPALNILCVDFQSYTTPIRKIQKNISDKATS